MQNYLVQMDIENLNEESVNFINKLFDVESNNNQAYINDIIRYIYDKDYTKVSDEEIDSLVGCKDAGDTFLTLFTIEKNTAYININSNDLPINLILNLTNKLNSFIKEDNKKDILISGNYEGDLYDNVGAFVSKNMFFKLEKTKNSYTFDEISEDDDMMDQMLKEVGMIKTELLNEARRNY